MADEIKFAGAPVGSTIYAILIQAAGDDYWNNSTPGFEPYNAANIASYAIPLTPDGSSGIWQGDKPASLSVAYVAIPKLQAGGGPAVSDVVIGYPAYAEAS